MSEEKQSKFQLNAGTGMVLGTLVGALIALLVSTVTGDQTVWSWAVPAGLASGLAIGAGRARGSKETNSD